MRSAAMAVPLQRIGLPPYLAARQELHDPLTSSLQLGVLSTAWAAALAHLLTQHQVRKWQIPDLRLPLGPHQSVS